MTRLLAGMKYVGKRMPLDAPTPKADSAPAAQQEGSGGLDTDGKMKASAPVCIDPIEHAQPDKRRRVWCGPTAAVLRKVPSLAQRILDLAQDTDIMRTNA